MMASRRSLIIWQYSTRLARWQQQRGLAEVTEAPKSSGQTAVEDGGTRGSEHDQQPGRRNRSSLDSARSASGRMTHDGYVKSIDDSLRMFRINLAKELFKDYLVEGYRPSLRLWSWMLGGFTRKRRPQDMRWLLDVMSQYGQALSAADYGKIAQCYGKCGDAQRILQILEEMNIRGLPLSKQVATAVVQSMGNLPMFAAKAREVFTESIRDGIDIKEDLELLTAAMDMAMSSGDVSLAENIISYYTSKNVPEALLRKYMKAVFVYGEESSMGNLISFLGGDDKVPQVADLAKFHLRTGDPDKALDCVRRLEPGSLIDEDLIDTLYRDCMHDQSQIVDFLAASEHLRMSPSAIDKVLSYFIDMDDAEQARVYAVRAKKVAKKLPRLKRTLGVKYVYFCKRRGDDAEAEEYKDL
eukprot:Plantae.Rhodophyta-Purpureofilum_apyrenoidigerum.ctg19354.p1 GENE.Plantae.Rhodophyta-Purpureofilum_apyrenoidigerum.ctg19354~~Plantae.Rhodophyta-Purpureofilum_apyrenoidigerum.ctg19354.p1  ORF type:complete len:412 (-),score=65.18 Plantae.Rhodophyta-Purpureofilum_apyrenoidigerum.ctg19354:914-2149(-)